MIISITFFPQRGSKSTWNTVEKYESTQGEEKLQKLEKNCNSLIILQQPYYLVTFYETEEKNVKGTKSLIYLLLKNLINSIPVFLLFNIQYFTYLSLTYVYFNRFWNYSLLLQLTNRTTGMRHPNKLWESINLSNS